MLTKYNDVQAVVLAGGCSSRLGQNKQLLKFAGDTLIQRTVKQLANLVDQPVWVITGFAHQDIVSELQNTNCRIIYNSQWTNGMGSSIALAASTLSKQNPMTSSALFVLPDQILIDANFISQMISTALSVDKTIIATSYAKTFGPPILFKSPHFAELAKLDGAQGAKSIIKQHQQHLWTLNFEAASIDIDRPEDLKYLNIQNSFTTSTKS